MPLHAAGKVTVKASGTATPAYQYGQEKELKLTITNGTDTAIEKCSSNSAGEGKY